MIMSFKAISEQHPDYDEVIRKGRFRGCKKGRPVIIPGYRDSDCTTALRKLKHILEQVPNSKVLLHTRTVLSIEIKEA